MKLKSTLDEQMEKQDILLGGMTDRKLAALRLILASGALTIIYLDPTEPDRYVPLTYYALVAYTAYSFLIYQIALRRINFSQSALKKLIWTDIACYSALISLSSGTNSIFFFFYLFAIIVASCRCGRTMGLSVTLTSSLLCVVAALITPPGNAFELNRFLLRPLAIVALGCTLASWGGAELTLKRRLALLKELSLVANPRFGIDRIIERMLLQILSFYDADHCVLLLEIDSTPQLYAVVRPDLSEVMDAAMIADLTRGSDSCPSVYGRRGIPSFERPSYRRYEPQTQRVVNEDPERGKLLSDLLHAESWITVPFQYREKFRGRLLVSSSRHNVFNIGDAVFLLQLASQVLPAIENIRLVDRLASDASEAERQRIARSVHDRVIQPYYGLQIGLKALHEILVSEPAAGNGVRPAPDRVRSVALLKELMTMTSDGITELREYVYGLKQTQTGTTRLVESLRRFAGKFENATGIAVKVADTNEGFAASDRLTAEVFQMAAEALSNVHRHTQSRSAQVLVDLQNDNLVLRVENETDADTGPVPFSPSSISERADALGGRTQVSWTEGRTVVNVEVPL